MCVCACVCVRACVCVCRGEYTPDIPPSLPWLPLQGEMVQFPDVMSLVIHHSMERGSLPCTLSLDAANPAYLLGMPGEEEEEPLDRDYLHIPQYMMLDH